MKIAVFFTSIITAATLANAGVAAEPEDGAADPATNTTVALGVGMERQPRYWGAATHKTQVVPYLDIHWHDQVELSTTDGLIIDLLHHEQWHGGIVGTLMWGRTAKDLGPLATRFNTLNNTVQGGVYAEYKFSKNLLAGMRLRHDVQSTGAAYGDVYAELDLSAPGPVEHSLKLDAAGMNRSAMRRFFGVSARGMPPSGSPAYEPDGGFASLTATYQLYVPLSKHAGISFAIEWSRLRGAAAQSPLVRDFGSRNQRNLLLTGICVF